jgi:hypothetical protein
VNYIKGGWINRNRILINGQSKMITLPLYNSSRNKLINEIEIMESPFNKQKILKSIQLCYMKAPYFSEVFQLIEKIINNDEMNLARYLESSIMEVCRYLSINTEIIISSSIDKNNNLKGQDKVIEICKKAGASEYFNAIGGVNLYSYRDFRAEGLKICFLRTGNIGYRQLKNEFVPNLSIIDVMMFNSADEIKKMLSQYELLQEEAYI